MKWYVITFENENEVANLKQVVFQILKENEYAFLDREDSGNHRLRIRGINSNIEEIVFRIEKMGQISVTEEFPTDFYINIEQFMLNCEIHHELDMYWLPYYFEKMVSVEDVIKNAEIIAKELTTYDEGYISHISRFWAFFISLENNEKREELLNYYEDRYSDFRKNNIAKDTRMINVSPYLEKVEKMIDEQKIVFYSPINIDFILKKDQAVSKLHREAVERMKQEQLYMPKYYIINRWYLNALHVSMILMKLPEVDRFFLNYCVAHNMYKIDEYCREYIKTGEVRIW